MRENIIKICEYKLCQKQFVDKSKKKNQRFCCKKCMYDWRKSLTYETATCLNCKSKFIRTIRIDKRTGKKQQYCSNNCNLTSKEKRQKLSKKFSGKNNPFARQEVIDKITKIKKEKYGTLAVNFDKDKLKEIILKKYGVPYGFNLSRGKISKLQKQQYQKIKKQYSDALLEHYLKDVEICVDIYIPSQKKVIEIYGDFWHMNPKLFKSNYVNPVTKDKASDKWSLDEKRINKLIKKGYDVQIIWESDI